MYSDLFEVRVARVRHRFATTLENKIETAMVSADRIARGDASVVKHVSDSYRHLHSIYGVGATVGFAATGESEGGPMASGCQLVCARTNETWCS